MPRWVLPCMCWLPSCCPLASTPTPPTLTNSRRDCGRKGSRKRSTTVRPRYTADGAVQRQADGTGSSSCPCPCCCCLLPLKALACPPMAAAASSPNATRSPVERVFRRCSSGSSSCARWAAVSARLLPLPPPACTRGAVRQRTAKPKCSTPMRGQSPCHHPISLAAGVYRVGAGGVAGTSRPDTTNTNDWPIIDAGGTVAGLNVHLTDTTHHNAPGKNAGCLPPPSACWWWCCCPRTPCRPMSIDKRAMLHCGTAVAAPPALPTLEDLSWAPRPTTAGARHGASSLSLRPGELALVLVLAQQLLVSKWLSPAAQPTAAGGVCADGGCRAGRLVLGADNRSGDTRWRSSEPSRLRCMGPQCGEGDLRMHARECAREGRPGRTEERAVGLLNRSSRWYPPLPSPPPQIPLAWDWPACGCTSNRSLPAPHAHSTTVPHAMMGATNPQLRVT